MPTKPARLLERVRLHLIANALPSSPKLRADAEPRSSNPDPAVGPPGYLRMPVIRHVSSDAPGKPAAETVQVTVSPPTNLIAGE